MKFFKSAIVSAAVTLLFLAPSQVAASTWGGHNGIVRLSFGDADSLVSVLSVEPDASGLTVVDLYAVLDGVDTVTYQDSTLTRLGGFEFELEIVGAQAVIMSQEFAFQNFNVGQKPGHVRVGVIGGLPLQNGRATIVHWELMFTDPPRDVMFRLDPEGALSCRSLEGCPGSGTDALFTGCMEEKLEGLMFSAVCAPAYLNMSEAPATVVEPGAPDWSEMGIFEQVAVESGP